VQLAGICLGAQPFVKKSLVPQGFWIDPSIATAARTTRRSLVTCAAGMPR
jgi:hypothetical protein